MTATMMRTDFLLMARYEGRPIIPLETVRADFFDHLTIDKFARKISLGEIKLPVVRIEASNKAARGVHIGALAAYLDERISAAEKEAKQLGHA